MDFTHAHAAEGANVTMTADQIAVNVGDTVKVRITNKEMTLAGFGIFLEFDASLLECTAIDSYYDEGDGYLCLANFIFPK